MASSAIAVQGTLVQRGNGATPEVFTTIAEVTGIPGLGGAAPSFTEVTHLLSTRKEWRRGLPDEGEITLPMNLIPSDPAQTGLWADLDSGVARNFKITFVDGNTASFAAIVAQLPIAAETDGVLRVEAVLRITGQITRSW
jgi:hypothetical protein